MVDILHRVGIKSSPTEVYAALTTVEGLSGWWVTNTQGKGNDVGAVFHTHHAAMKVVDLNPGKRVLWEVVDGPQEWIGTHVDFNLDQADGYTIVLFNHQGWKEPVELMHHCSTKWAIFLMSLKSLLETGKGTPYPHDVKIDNWN
jgi:uncharacterized protein YndB with AHSA1/START domain